MTVISANQVSVVHLEFMARVAHEQVMGLCACLGQPTISWEQASDMDQSSTREQILACVNDPNMNPQENWRIWAQNKTKAGWVWGPIKDADAKTHPCLVDSYDKVPFEERVKDHIFLSTVRGMATADMAALCRILELEATDIRTNDADDLTALQAISQGDAGNSEVPRIVDLTSDALPSGAKIFTRVVVVDNTNPVIDQIGQAIQDQLAQDAYQGEGQSGDPSQAG